MPAIDIEFKQAKVNPTGPECLPQAIALKRRIVRDPHFPIQNINKKRHHLIAGSNIGSTRNATQNARCDTTNCSCLAMGPVNAISILADNDDLTNLNWLQDSNLLKNIYSLETSTDNHSREVTGVQPKPELKRTFLIRPTRNFANYGQICEPLKSKTNFLNHSKLQQHQKKLTQQRQFPIKPPYSYSALIYMAIESSPTKSMMVRDIYKWIVNKFPYFATAPPGWKNTIRHTLSLRKYFKKMEKWNGTTSLAEVGTSSDSDSDRDSNSLDMKGGYWYVDLDYKQGLQQLVDRTELSMKPKLAIRNGRQIRKANKLCQLNLHKIPFLLPVNLVRLSNERNHIETNPPRTEQNAVNTRKDCIRVPTISSAKLQGVIRGHSSNVASIYQKPVSRLIDSTSPNDVKLLLTNKFPLNLQRKLDKIYTGKNSEMFGYGKQLSPRNSVSVISVNQTPKVFAPVPMLSKSTKTRTEAISQRQSSSNRVYFNGNILRKVSNVDVQNYAINLTNNNFSPKYNTATRKLAVPNGNILNVKDETGLSNGRASLPTSAVAVPRLVMKTITNSEANANGGQGTAPFQSQFDSISIKSAATSRNSAASNLAGRSDFGHCHHFHQQHWGSSTGDDSDDDLILDGAQALLKFASGAFELNCLIKQED